MNKRAFLQATIETLDLDGPWSEEQLQSIQEFAHKVATRLEAQDKSDPAVATLELLHIIVLNRD